MLFNHCKHQRWRIWWRENWLLLCVFDQAGLWRLLFPSFSAWASYATPPRGLRLWDLHMECISLPTSPSPEGMQPQGWCHSQWRGSHSYPTMDTDRPCCHSVSQGQRPSWTSLETHTLLLQDPSPMSFSLQCWKTSGVKKPEKQSLVGIHERCASTVQQSRDVQATSEWDNRGTAGGFLPQDGAQCRQQSISRKLHKYSSVWISLHSLHRQLCLQADKLQSDWKKIM